MIIADGLYISSGFLFLIVLVLAIVWLVRHL